MGKRRERRLAALSNVGRRVKLDLFAEPSGDLDGSDGHEEVGGDIDTRQTTKLPKSASSSGGFYQCSSKGLCKGDMSASHYNGGYFKLYVQDFVFFAPRICFQSIG